MSEKVTFQELIDAISEETDHSKRFTHDFMKGLVSVIHEGLEEDRKVNIAGFGKFGLKKVDEREGYNPQTGEAMTIPAHNRVTFKAYKDLRERVNAPYADREPELVDKDEEEDTKTQQPDFIPTAPPTRRGSSGERTAAGGESSVVEYAPEMNGPEPVEDDGVQEDTKSSEEIFDTPGAAPSGRERGEPEDRFGFRKSRRHERSDANWPLIMAAAFVILVIVAASWMLSADVFDHMSGEEPASSVAQVEEAGDDRPASGRTASASPGKSEEALNEITGDNETVSRRVDEGQTLWSMARQEYDDPYLWPWIYGTNTGNLDNPDLIYAGTSLSVPLPEGPSESLSLSDSLSVAMGYVESYRWYKDRDREEAKYFLYAARQYHGEVLDHTSIDIDRDDLAFATRPR